MSNQSIALQELRTAHPLHTRHLDRCPHCGGEFKTVYQNIPDLFELVDDRFAVCYCPTCSLHFTQPQPEGDLSILYPDFYLSSAHNENSEKPGVMARAEAWYRDDQSAFDFSLLGHGGLQSLSNVRSYVDVGCGTGHRVAWMMHQGCQNCLGIDAFDFFNAGINKTRHFRQCAIEDFKPATRIELVSLFHVLEHLPEPKTTLRHLHDHVCSHDGILLIQVPNYGSLERKIFGTRWSALDIPRHFYHFDAQSIRRVLEDSGFEVVKIVQRNARLHPVTFASSLWHDLHIQRIWVRSQLAPSMRWTLMKLLWMFITLLSIPLNIVFSLLGTASMLSVVAKPRKQNAGSQSEQTRTNNGRQNTH